MLFHKLILSIHEKLQDERSISATYHILQGKKSIQTLQDTNLFHLQSFYGIYKNLDKTHYDETIQSLVKQGFLLPLANENYYELTVKGKKLIQSSILDQFYFNGYHFKDIDQLFLKRMLLIIQVWTNMLRGNKQFIPIIDQIEVTNWVKYFYMQSKRNIKTNLQKLHDELHGLFTLLHYEDVELFIGQFSSYKLIGLTKEQLSNKFSKSIDDIELTITHVLHFILDKVFGNIENYPILFALIGDVNHNNKLTASAQLTERFIHQGLTIEEIANRRNLKVSTIQDHIVEIALNDDLFPILKYVKEEDLHEVTRVVHELDTFKLKPIKERVDAAITYFQIRLILTYIQKKNEYR